MLVLTRKEEEIINIGNGLIEIMILDIRGDKVRVGIEAPKDMSVHRQEIQDIIDGKTNALEETTP